MLFTIKTNANNFKMFFTKISKPVYLVIKTQKRKKRTFFPLILISNFFFRISLLDEYLSK